MSLETDIPKISRGALEAKERGGEGHHHFHHGLAAPCEVRGNL